jgi:hydroxyacylglutathione hydrolase
MLQIWPIPVFSDNYVWVLERDGSDRVAVVDPGEAEPVIRALDERGLTVAAVLLTHHHQDHIGGLADVVRRFGPPVYGSASDGIEGVDHPVAAGDTVALADLDVSFDVVALPGHTLNHVGYLGDGVALVGDTLFAGGCGRVFEGTFEQMYDSLTGLAALPDDTKAYCAHEYTVANLRFARLVEPDNEALADRLEAARTARDEGLPTVPSTIGYERATNPFLRCTEPAVVGAAERRAERPLEPGAEVFGVIRSWKDGWSG